MNIQDINRLNYSAASVQIKMILKSDITDTDLIELLSLKDKSLISDFLEEYDNFSKTQLNIIEDFINNNYKCEDLFFLSNLIDIADMWGLSLDYKNLLYYLKNTSKEFNLVVLSTIWYIHNNFKFYYFEEIKECLEEVLNNSKNLQSIQISAALCLFRHTHKFKYVNEIRGWGDTNFNKVFVENTFNEFFFKEDFFDKNTKLKILKTLQDF